LQSQQFEPVVSAHPVMAHVEQALLHHSGCHEMRPQGKRATWVNGVEDLPCQSGKHCDHSPRFRPPSASGNSLLIRSKCITDLFVIVASPSDVHGRFSPFRSLSLLSHHQFRSLEHSFQFRVLAFTFDSVIALFCAFPASFTILVHFPTFVRKVAPRKVGEKVKYSVTRELPQYHS
jgi:predicted 2-oxoglutarate/Fe(II)-dependent dioxygenase YbiX